MATDAKAAPRRTVPMRVIAPGLGRTGTASMQLALEQLGYIKTSHGFDLLEQHERPFIWNEAIDAKFHGKGKPWGREDFDRVLWDYQAVTDIPSNAFAEELIAAYPEAKVVLVGRDVDAWAHSYTTGVLGSLFSWPTWLIMVFVEPILGQCNAHMNRRAALGQMLRASGPDEARRNAKAAYAAHYASVRAVTPPDRLLEFDVRDGWAPLCAFLGVPVPDAPFPRVNEAAALKVRVAAIQKRMFLDGAVKLAGILSPVIGVGIAAAGFWWFEGSA